jgi:hypothetical protein
MTTTTNRAAATAVWATVRSVKAKHGKHPTHTATGLPEGPRKVLADALARAISTCDCQLEIGKRLRGNATTEAQVARHAAAEEMKAAQEQIDTLGKIAKRRFAGFDVRKHVRAAEGPGDSQETAALDSPVPGSAAYRG